MSRIKANPRPGIIITCAASAWLRITITATIIVITTTITIATIIIPMITPKRRAFAAPNSMNDYIRDPAEIYRRSVEAIRREIDLSRFPGGMAEVALRLVHACAIPEIVGDVVFSPGAAESGKRALESGAAIFVDG